MGAVIAFVVQNTTGQLSNENSANWWNFLVIQICHICQIAEDIAKKFTHHCMVIWCCILDGNVYLILSYVYVTQLYIGVLRILPRTCISNIKNRMTDCNNIDHNWYLIWWYILNVNNSIFCIICGPNSVGYWYHPTFISATSMSHDTNIIKQISRQPVCCTYTAFSPQSGEKA